MNDDFKFEDLTERQLKRLAVYYNIYMPTGDETMLQAVERQLKVEPDGSITRKETVHGKGEPMDEKKKKFFTFLK